ncbi:unnamed protein product [Dracunculus medinensis]|uniref:Uncharacterized protein n=1 Tax=Dracunculus medinensis TaxID=318479 RepID=A0A158Q4F1_DRAME|nr:unnamed protein product [Dracunculus medinensis]
MGDLQLNSKFDRNLESKNRLLAITPVNVVPSSIQVDAPLHQIISRHSGRLTNIFFRKNSFSSRTKKDAACEPFEGLELGWWSEGEVPRNSRRQEEAKRSGDLSNNQFSGLANFGTGKPYEAAVRACWEKYNENRRDRIMSSMF